MRVLLVEALERTHTGVFVPPGTSRQALEFIQIVKVAFLAERVDDAVYVHVRCFAGGATKQNAGGAALGCESGTVAPHALEPTAAATSAIRLSTCVVFACVLWVSESSCGHATTWQVRDCGVEGVCDALQLSHILDAVNGALNAPHYAPSPIHPFPGCPCAKSWGTC